MIFNNATSLPLLLLQALGKIGTLKSLVGDDEDMSEVLARGKVSGQSGVVEDARLIRLHVLLWMGRSTC
jgi:hypothetical protein